jgi:hypothetical protein
MNSLLYKILEKGILMFMIVSMTIFNIPISSIAASDDQQESEEVIGGQASDSSPVKNDTEPEHQAESTIDETDPGEEDSESVDGLTMLYIGGAIAGVAALAIALGSSSGSSDPGTPPPESTPPPSEPTPTPPSPEPDPPSLPSPPSDPSTNPPVGPNLNGADWAGFLEIKDSRYKGFQYISARIVHSGNAVQINTSSNLHYGRQFNGTISSGGYMLMYDSISGEDWTTHRGDATTNRVDLYDYVNWFEDLDRMKLTR